MSNLTFNLDCFAALTTTDPQILMWVSFFALSLPLGTLAAPLFSAVGKILADTLAEEESLKKLCITEEPKKNVPNNSSTPVEMVTFNPS